MPSRFSAVPETYRLRFVHISDLHVRSWPDAKAGDDRNKMLLDKAGRYKVLAGNFETELEKIGQRQIDFVCFTGDLAHGGLREEYEQAEAFLAGLRAKLKVPEDRFFIVPGNHDINRDTRNDVWTELRACAAENPDAVSALMDGSTKLPRFWKPEWSEQIRERSQEFRDWLEKNCPGIHGKLDLGYRETLTYAELPFPVHIIGLDTAWLAGDDNDDKKLLLTPAQIRLAAMDEKTGGVLAGFKLALLHHPSPCLADEAACEKDLAEYAHLVLHGHQHKPIAKSFTDPDRSLAALGAGCLYESDDKYPNSFYVVEAILDKHGRPLRYDIDFWGWSGDHWFPTGAIYKEAKNGHLEWWTPLGEKWKAEIERQGLATELIREPSPRRIFVGRSEELGILKQALLQDGQPLPGMVCSLVGMPGVGKSWIVEQFHADNTAAFPGKVIGLVFEAETKTAARDLIAKLQAAFPPAEGLEPVFDRLIARIELEKPLIHIENVDDESAASVVVEFVAQVRAAPIIITGRFDSFRGNERWQKAYIRPFDEDVAVEQLCAEVDERTLACIEDKDRRNLVTALGGLPLAIHLAAGYLTEGHTVESFLNELREKGLSLKPIYPDDNDYSDRTQAALSATFDISLSALRKKLSAEQFTAFCSLGMAPRVGFGLKLGSAIVGVDELAFPQMISAAKALSLVELAPEQERKDRAWRIHPLIAEHLRNQLSAENRSAAEERIYDWFLSRLEGEDEENHTEKWDEIDAERPALIEWLTGLTIEQAREVGSHGYDFAQRRGPYGIWAEVAAKGLSDDPTYETQSRLLWRCGNLARRAGDLDRALECAEKKYQIETDGGKEREAALAAGLKADVFSKRGNLDEALKIRTEEQLPVYEKLGDIREKAVTMWTIADTLQARGKLDEALKNLEEIAPVFEKLDDIRSKAATMGKIADILQARGKLDEALKIRREEQLPVYEKLGDIREKAVTMGKIADILQARGRLDEALKIRTEEQLPVYEKLGDIREEAVTMGEIAYILRQEGRLDEAMRNLEEIAPVFEKLGDIRTKAETMGRIADILHDRGQLDEAFKIRTEEQLPIYEKLGDIRSKAVTMCKIADILHDRGNFDEAMSNLEEIAPVFEKLGDIRTKAGTRGRIADILQARGQLDEALKIRTEEELPVYEKMRSARDLCICRAKIADNLALRNKPGDLKEARRLMGLAFDAATEIGLPEAVLFQERLDVLK
jgi:tetratricopeptide (TPR) repeat protein